MDKRTIIAVATMVLALAPRAVSATTRLVFPDGSGDYPSIQAAIDSSVTGDSILLADGTYRDIDPLGIIPWGKDLTFRSVSGNPEACIIDAEGGYGFNISHGETRACRVEALTVCNASGQFGGGIHIRGAAPTISGCTIRDNWGSDGGGIFAYQLSGPRIENCHIYGNACSWYEGLGGGMYLQGDSLEVVGCTIENNDAGSIGEGVGGGICASGEILIQDCVIRNNVAGTAGGGCAISGYSTVENCKLYGNTAGLLGGGFALFTSPWAGVTITGTTIVDNAAPEGAALVNRNAFVGYENGPALLDRCLVTDQKGITPPFASNFANSLITLSCSDVFGNQGGDWVGGIAGQFGVEGNFSADPLFCDPDGGVYTLSSASPCLPAHNECGVLVGALGQGCTATAVAETSPAAAVTLANHPNPFNAHTRIDFATPAAGSVDLRVYDLQGRELMRLLDGEWVGAGAHSLDWDGRDAHGNRLPSGVYPCRLRSAAGEASLKLILLQ